MGDKHLESERVVIETYLQEHGLETTLNDAVNAVVKARPRDPYVQLGKALLKASDGADAVAAVAAREILGSSGRPALEVEIETQRGTFVGVASSGPYDDDADRHGGKGLLKARDAARAALPEVLRGRDVVDQTAVDAILAEALQDGRLPANAVAAASAACCVAGAAHADVAPHAYIAKLAGQSGGAPRLPLPVVRIVDGQQAGAGATGLHAAGISVAPASSSSLEEALDLCAAVHEKVPAACVAKNVPPPAFGRGGGYALVVSGDRAAKALEVVVEACRLAGADDKVALSLECGAHALVAKSDADDDDESPAYDVEAFAYGDASFSKSGAEMVEDYAALLAAFPVDTLEDPFAEHDVDAFVQLKERLDAAANGDASAGPPPKKRGPVGGDSTCAVQLVGAACCGDGDAVDAFDERKSLNTLNVTLAKGRTVSVAVALAAHARGRGWGLVVSSDGDDGAGVRGPPRRRPPRGTVSGRRSPGRRTRGQVQRAPAPRNRRPAGRVGRRRLPRGLRERCRDSLPRAPRAVLGSNLAKIGACPLAT